MRLPSSDVLSVEECPLYIYSKCHISCRSSRYIPAIKQTTSDQLTANHATVGNPCSYTQCHYTRPDSAWFQGASWLSLVPFWLVANYIIFRSSHFLLWSSSSPFHNSKSWLQKYFNQVRLKPNRAERQVLQTLRQPERRSSNIDSS